MTANLLSRLQGLTAPDREVDAHVHALAIGGRVHFTDEDCAVIERPIDGMWIRGIYPLKGKKIPLYTASLDAAVALCERVLPGQLWHILMAALKEWSKAEGKPEDLPRFVLIAILTALEARDGKA